MFRYVSIAFFVLLIAGWIDAQQSDDRPIPKQISGGVLNGKAISLPKPAFPPAARAVGASGAVSVQVLIDEEGSVVSANAVSGHPLLRAAAVQAAQGAKFAPTTLQGHPVKVAGVITYNFVGPLYPAKLGYTVAYAAKSGKFESGTNPKSLAYQLPADWSREISTLNELTFEKIEPKLEPVKPPPAQIQQRPSDPNRYTVKGDVNFSAANLYEERLDTRSVAELRDLIPVFAARHEANQKAAWGFELGMALGELAAAIDGRENLAGALSKIESLVERAPAPANESAIGSLRNLIEIGKAPDVDLGILRENTLRLANLRY